RFGVFPSSWPSMYNSAHGVELMTRNPGARMGAARRGVMTAGGLVVVAARRGGGGEGRGGVTATLVEPAGAAATGMDVRVEPAGATCDVGPESNAVGVSGAIRAAGAKSHQAMPTAASATVPSTSRRPTLLGG